MNDPKWSHPKWSQLIQNLANDWSGDARWSFSPVKYNYDLVGRRMGMGETQCIARRYDLDPTPTHPITPEPRRISHPMHPKNTQQDGQIIEWLYCSLKSYTDSYPSHWKRQAKLTKNWLRLLVSISTNNWLSGYCSVRIKFCCTISWENTIFS